MSLSKPGKFFLAGILGAVTGLLFAPKSGKKTREDLGKIKGKIDKSKYAAIVNDVVEEFKDDLTKTKSGAVKIANQLKKDWKKVKQLSR